MDLEEAIKILNLYRKINDKRAIPLTKEELKFKLGEDFTQKVSEAIQVVLEELDKKDKVDRQKKLIDLLHCEIVYYYVCKNDGYYWDGFVVLKCDDKYCVVEYKGSQSGWIKNQIESVDKEFLDNVIGNRKLDNIDDDFPSYFNTFLETTYNYPIPDTIMQQLKDQDAILLDFEDIKKHIKEERNAR